MRMRQLRMAMLRARCRRPPTHARHSAAREPDGRHEAAHSANSLLLLCGAVSGSQSDRAAGTMMSLPQAGSHCLKSV
jgi:hypothetical protein